MPLNTKEILAKLDQVQISLELDGLSAYAILGNLQLALRHPGNVGPSAKLTRQIAQLICDELARADPDLGRLSERGFYGCFDVPRKAGHG